MIKTLNIENFQSHLNSNLNFSSGINCITGVSDAGKSAIMRSLSAIFRKTPMYLTRRTETGTISAETENTIISRTRTDSKLLKCPSCKVSLKPDEQICLHCGEVLSRKPQEDKYTVDGTVYEKFGVNLPDQITERTRIKPISFNEFEFDINFASQHDDMFFIGSTFNSARNKMISSLCKDSELIDNAIKKCRSTSNSLKTRYDYITEENKKLIKIEEDLSPDTNCLQALLNIISNTEGAIEILEDEVYTLEDLYIFLSKGYILSEVPKVQAVQKVLEKLSANIGKVDIYRIEIDSIESIYRDMVTLSPKIQCSLQELDILQLNTLHQEVQKLYTDVMDIDLYNMDIYLYNQVKGCDISSCKVNKEYITEIETYSRDLEELIRISNGLKKPAISSIDSLPTFDISEVDRLEKELKELETSHTDIQIHQGSVELYTKKIDGLTTELNECRKTFQDTFKQDCICPLTSDRYCEGCVDKIIRK